MYRVAVLMSTYNGHKFLCEQIDSILNQKGIDVTLFIRDDGSYEKTIALLYDYKSNPKIKISFGENIGVGNSFMKLLYNVALDYDYYCFSDQDDIWDEDKVITAINRMQFVDSPCLYTSNQLLVDECGIAFGKRYNDVQPPTYSRIVCSNQFSGCTFVWNNGLQKILSNDNYKPEESFFKVRIHDVWVILVAVLAGMVIYDEEPHIRYRIHSDNVVGTNERGEKFLKLLAIKHNIQQGKMSFRSQTCKIVLDKLCDFLSEEQKVNTQEHISYKTDIRIKFRLLCRQTPFFLSYSESILSYRIKIILNLW